MRQEFNKNKAQLIVFQLHRSIYPSVSGKISTNAEAILKEMVVEDQRLTSGNNHRLNILL